MTARVPTIHRAYRYRSHCTVLLHIYLEHIKY